MTLSLFHIAAMDAHTGTCVRCGCVRNTRRDQLVTRLHCSCTWARQTLNFPVSQYGLLRDWSDAAGCYRQFWPELRVVKVI